MVVVHFVFLLLVLISPPFIFRKKTHKPLIVKTITRPPPSLAATTYKSAQPQGAKPTVQKPAIAPAPSPKTPPLKKEAPPKTNPTPAVKKESPKPVIQPKKEPAVAEKTLSKNPKPISKQSPPPPQPQRAKISDSLLKELEEGIAKIEGKSYREASSKSSPLLPLQIDIPTPMEDLGNDGAIDYAGRLVSIMQQSLRLPEYGEVKMQLTLRQDGTVAKVVVLKTQSDKNKSYLESALLKIRFPCFEGVFADKKENTFILTFCNG